MDYQNQNQNPIPPLNPTRVGNLPNTSEAFGTIRNHAESFGSVPKFSERTENHTLTVREAARMFEVAGVARTERSIVNWCQLNAQGMARLDAYFDPNERKYFITPQSVELAIAEEKAKAARTNEPSELRGTVRKHSESDDGGSGDAGEFNKDIKSLEHQVRDLQITNRAKDMFIERLEKERVAFNAERQWYVEKLMTFNHRIGELETQLLQISGPRENKVRKLEVRTDSPDFVPETE